MWTKVRNNSRYPLDDPQEHNLTQIISPVFSWLPFSSERNGSITANPPAHDGNPADRTSGIIPGAIAGAVFIGFLLALYAVLWKCMVTQPKRLKHMKSVCVESYQLLTDMSRAVEQPIRAELNIIIHDPYKIRRKRRSVKVREQRSLRC